MAYTKKPLEDLNVIDDFLMNRLASDQEVGEEFLERVPADDAGEGTAMKIYDIEPHLVEGTDLPRHNRFYQALSDSSNLKSGETDYKNLPNLYILMILNKDPFGYDYMMYSIRNKCEEVKEMEYEDGLRFYYFYTGGSKGGSDEIKTMLRYIMDSRKENATDAATKIVHRFTEKVKVHPEVRKSYMLWEEYVYLLKKELRLEVEEEEKAETILELLGDFGEIPEKIVKRIRSEKDVETLKRWIKLAAKGNSIEEFERMM